MNNMEGRHNGAGANGGTESCSSSTVNNGPIQRRNSMLQEKIDVVQKVLTILETTMSSAKVCHQNKKTECNHRIKQLQLQIEKVQREMEDDEEAFKTATAVLETNIHKYIASENKLITVEEMSQDDYVTLPDLDLENDLLIEEFREDDIDVWRQLRMRCQQLNYNTKNSFQEDVLVRRFKVLMPPIATQIFHRAAETANALNSLRGKKVISTSHEIPIPTTKFVTITCYKNEHTAVDYVDNNYSQIIEQVLRDEREIAENSLVITELVSTDELDPATLMERTIHVQAKTKAALNAPSIPRKITLYQFDEVTSSPSHVTTISVEASVVNERGNSMDIESHSVSPIHSIKQIGKSYDTCKTVDANGASPKVVRKAKYNRRQIAQKTSKILSSIGIEIDVNDNSSDNEESVQAGPSSSKIIASVSGGMMPSPLTPLSSKDNSDTVIDGVNLSEWTWQYVCRKRIKWFTKSQKELLSSFKFSRDVLLKGPCNSGKTTGIVIGLIDHIRLNLFKPQALIVTPNLRCSKLIQKGATVDDGQNVVICKRLEDIKNENLCKVIKSPLCHILVGTAAEMQEMISKGFAKSEFIKLLILYKIEDVFGPESVKKKFFKTVKQILYKLDATIKVIVVCKSTGRVCPEMQQIYGSLRNKILIEESLEIEEFLHAQRQHERSDCTDHIEETTSEQNNFKSSVTKSSSQEPEVIELDDTDEDEDLYSDATTPEHDRLAQSSTSSKPNDETGTAITAQTFLPLHGARFLGIYTGPRSPNSTDVDVVHFYANIDGGSAENFEIRANVISMLDLEQDKAIIFCNSIRRTEWLSTLLRQKQLWPQVLHEGVSRSDQKAIMENYRQGTFCRVLICTDFVISFSLDSADVVLNFDLPESPIIYLQRAAFALRHITQASSSEEKKGVVVTLIGDNDETGVISEFQNSLGITIHNCEDD